MATTYGAPTGLDLSGCSVTATGGSTSITLADLNKSVNDAATSISTANSVAASAADKADAAYTAINNLDETFIPSTSIGAENGVAGLDSSGNIIGYCGGYGYTGSAGMTTYMCLGNYSDNKGTAGNGYGAIQFGNGGNSGNPVTINTWADGTGRQLALQSDVFHPSFDNMTSLGLADHAWSNIYSKTAVQVTSDATQKTVIGSLADTSYEDGQKLLSALFSLDTSMFQLNDSIASKGADAARLHAGFIAQQVQAAITAAGLSPAKYALWTNSQVFDVVQKDTGNVDKKGNPITVATATPKLDSNGQPVYTQMLRYEQILCVLYEASKVKISNLLDRVSALEEKVNNLAVSTTTSAGSAG